VVVTNRDRYLSTTSLSWSKKYDQSATFLNQFQTANFLKPYSFIFKEKSTPVCADEYLDTQMASNVREPVRQSVLIDKTLSLY